MVKQHARSIKMHDIFSLTWHPRGMSPQSGLGPTLKLLHISWCRCILAILSFSFVTSTGRPTKLPVLSIQSGIELIQGTLKIRWSKKRMLVTQDVLKRLANVHYLHCQQVQESPPNPKVVSVAHHIFTGH